MEKKLSTSWITEGWMDFEYKKYILLAYLKYVREHFDQSRLYPPLAELAEHYENLVALRDNTRKLEGAFPKDIQGINWSRLELTYEKLLGDNQAIAVIGEIVEFAIPEMHTLIAEGKELYNWAEHQMNLEKIGIEPLYKDEGYLMLHPEPGTDVFVFRYQMSLIERYNEKFRALKTEYIETNRRDFVNSFENMKQSLVGRFRDLPNPAAFLIRSRFHLPLGETFLPIARRMLLKELSSPAA